MKTLPAQSRWRSWLCGAETAICTSLTLSETLTHRSDHNQRNVLYVIDLGVICFATIDNRNINAVHLYSFNDADEVYLAGKLTLTAEKNVKPAYLNILIQIMCECLEELK